MGKIFAILLSLALISFPAAANEPAATSPYLKSTYDKAMRGEVAAQYNLALAYHKGQDVPQDDTLAAKWLRKAAEAGDLQAQTNLGDFYRNGMGVEKSDTEAAKWFNIAANRGKAKAQYSLGILLHDGNGIKQDKAQALNWFKRSAEQGYVPAQISLGFNSLQGEGGQMDYEKAYYWFAIAARENDEEAVTLRERVSKALSAEQLDAVNKQVKAWSPKPEPQR